MSKGRFKKVLSGIMSLLMVFDKSDGLRPYLTEP